MQRLEKYRGALFFVTSERLTRIDLDNSFLDKDFNIAFKFQISSAVKLHPNRRLTNPTPFLVVNSNCVKNSLSNKDWFVVVVIKITQISKRLIGTFISHFSKLNIPISKLIVIHFHPNARLPVFFPDKKLTFLIISLMNNVENSLLKSSRKALVLRIRPKVKSRKVIPIHAFHS